MKITSKTLISIYAIITLIALLNALYPVINYFHLGPMQGTATFWKDTLINPASRFITLDIFLLSLSVFVLLLIELRKLKLNTAWALFYVLFAALIGVSVAVPLFLVHREKIRQQTKGLYEVGELKGADIAILLCFSLAIGVYAYFTYCT